MKLYLIAGEKSGDLHGGNLIAALKKENPNIEIRFWGGDRMKEAAGTEPVVHIKELAVMGFWEVVKQLFKFRKLLKQCEEDIKKYQSDGVIFIDYGGFNMRMAKFVHGLGIPTFYYISPKLWAWNSGRAKKVKKYIDHMLVILPFEEDFYAQFDYPVTYVGNPLQDAVTQFRLSGTELNIQSKKPIIAILPGSRKQEVQALTPLIPALKNKFPDFDFYVAGVREVDASLYEPISAAGIHVLYDQTYELLEAAEAAVVTSGTATLETAILDCPQVVVYKTGQISYRIAKLLIEVEYISLVNLIAQEEVVKEVIQSPFDANTIAEEIVKILPQGEKHEHVLRGYQKVRQVLGQHQPSQEAALEILKRLTS
ncbi:MAG: lipid-A-disaccharide synthase [Cyclobacteriaceae bacterium]|nr:lipid-A-disaccharide synthase [Cyclobacteriaceae bacterium]MCH8515767.1 lipid-A-disaccharide synthase [Cyclobacteriaceae bacterium]